MVESNGIIRYALAIIITLFKSLCKLANISLDFSPQCYVHHTHTMRYIPPFYPNH